MTLYNSVWKNAELTKECKDSIAVPIYGSDKKDGSDYRGISFYRLHTKFYPTSCCQSKFHIQRKLLGIISMDFEVTDPLYDHIFSDCQIL